MCALHIQEQVRSNRVEDLLAPLLNGSSECVISKERFSYRDELRDLVLPMPGKGTWRHSNFVNLVKEALSFEEQVHSDIDVSSLRCSALTATNEPNVLQDITTRSTQEFRPLLALNGLLYQQGQSFTTPPSQQSSEQVSTRSRCLIKNDAAGIERFVFTASEATKIHLKESFSQGNRVILCDVRDRAEVDIDLVLPQGSSTGYHHLALVLAKNAKAKLSLVGRGSKLLRNEILVVLAGEEAEVTLEGGWRLTNSNHLDNQVQVHHLAPKTTSTQRFHGVVEDRARSAFSGLIHIHHDAGQSEAHLKNHNVAVSPTARAMSQPELEIYTDDVICSHGATTGQLSDEALTYLCSRGIDRSQAQELLLAGFLREVTSGSQAKELLAL